jgi:23S rRNA (guanine745-N1)-methyltransferase
VLDAGCGEGTYTRAIYDALAAKGGCPQLLGADISAEGIFCAASTAHLPLAAESLDLIVNIFSPLMAEEFLRVLKPGGYLLRVVPMERHLFELKAAVYDRPYENPPAEPAVEGFRLLRTQTLRKTITLSSNEDVQALFLMTPYYYKTGAEDQQKLAAVPSLRVTTEFLIAVCQKP